MANIAAKHLDLDVASGTASIQGRFEDTVWVHVASGRADIYCETMCPNTVKADMASGNVVVSIPENDGFTARVDKASGSFSCDFETLMQGEGLSVYKSGAASFDIDIASGSFAIRKLA